MDRDLTFFPEKWLSRIPVPVRVLDPLNLALTKTCLSGGATLDWILQFFCRQDLQQRVIVHAILVASFAVQVPVCPIPIPLCLSMCLLQL